MIIKQSIFGNYKDRILSFDYCGDESLREFIIEKSGDISVCFSTHNEYINTQAEILIVGICPGRQQTIQSLNTAREMLASGYDEESILMRSKFESRLLGSTRNNLIDMLTEIGLDEISDLFSHESDRLHTTSLIRYPVFTGDEFKNYNGHTPKLSRNELIRKYALGFADEVDALKNVQLIIPLGKAVEEFMMALFESEELIRKKILRGLPHPSGANGHRKRMFEKHKESLQSQLSRIMVGE